MKPSINVISILKEDKRSLAELARITTVSSGHLSKLLRGESDGMSVATALNICRPTLKPHTFEALIFGVEPITEFEQDSDYCSPTQLGKMIQTWRKDIGQSLRVFAMATAAHGNVRISHATLHRIETGEIEQVEIDILYSIADTLDRVWWEQNGETRSWKALHKNAKANFHLRSLASAIWCLQHQSSSNSAGPSLGRTSSQKWTYFRTPKDTVLTDKASDTAKNPDFKTGQRVIITDLLKIFLADGTPVNIPAMTEGVIKEASSDEGLAIVKCSPITTGFEVSFIVMYDDDEVMSKISPWFAAALPPIEPVYDEDMPGFLREINEYVMDEDGTDEVQYLLYLRRAWTPWRVEVHFPQESGNDITDVTGVFRTAWVEGREAEQFTLLPKVEEFSLVQIQMISANRIRTYAYIPAEIKVDVRKKVVEITILCTFTFKNGKLAVSLLQEELDINSEDPDDDSFIEEWTDHNDGLIIANARYHFLIDGGFVPEGPDDLIIPEFEAPRRAIFIRIDFPSDIDEKMVMNEDVEDVKEQRTLMVFDPPTDEDALTKWVDRWVRRIGEEKELLKTTEFEVWILEDNEVDNFRSWVHPNKDGQLN